MGQIYFRMSPCVVKIFYVGPKFVCGSIFLRGIAFIIRWYYFTAPQVIIYTFFGESLPSKPCPNSVWLFLSGLLEVCKISMSLWLSSTRELQTDLILKEDASTTKPCAHPDSPNLFWKFYPFLETFSRKRLSERMLYHTLNRIFRFLHSYTRISIIFCKINYVGQSRQVFS